MMILTLPGKKPKSADDSFPTMQIEVVGALRLFPGEFGGY
jgi:hypothetical protein